MTQSVAFQSLRGPDWPQHVRFILLVILLALCAFFGGASRVDVPGMAVVKPAAILIGAVSLLLPGALRWREFRVLFLLLLAFAVVIAIQLIPLPPGIWTSLPGHARFAEIAPLLGMEQPWRPISVTPDLTISALTALTIPAAALFLLAGMSSERAWKLLPWLLGLVALSALFGAGQMAGGSESPFYLYEVTNVVSAVGLFANRNHQALFLALGIPMLAVWAGFQARESRTWWLPWAAAAIGALLLLPMLAVTGSRAGVIAAPVGLAIFWLVLRGRLATMLGGRYVKLATFGPLILIAVLGVVGLLLKDTEAFQRIFATSFAEEPRAKAAPTMLKMFWDFFPFGSGFGSFDPVFRLYEPFELLKHGYLNHAHNDVLELGITGGLPALAIGAGLLVWIGRKLLATLFGPKGTRDAGFRLLAATMVVFILASSAVDYPLRTPLVSLLFSIACAWLTGSPERSKPAHSGTPEGENRALR